MQGGGADRAPDVPRDAAVLNPDGTLGPDVKVTLPRPRDRMALNDSPVFKALRVEITQYLMEVGIAAKAPSVRQLPVVTPRHALPSAYAKAIKAAVKTYPHTDYDLEELLTQLGTGEAVVTVLGDKGTPTPVAHTMMRAPQSLMAPSAPELLEQTTTASPLAPKYSEALDRESAYEKLSARLEAAPAPGEDEAKGEAEVKCAP